MRCTNPATTQPSVATRRRTPCDCTRATAARSSRNPSATSTASRCAPATTSATGSDGKRPQQRHALGRSRKSGRTPAPNAAADPANRSSPVAGCCPSTRARSCVGLHHPRQPKRLCPPARPHPRATRPPRRSTRRCSTPPTRSGTPRRQPRHRQHRLTTDRNSWYHPTAPRSRDSIRHQAPLFHTPPRPPSPPTPKPAKAHRHLPALRGGNPGGRHAMPPSKSSVPWPGICMAGTESRAAAEGPSAGSGVVA